MIRPRLQAAGADLDRAHVVTIEEDGVGGLVTFPDDLPMVEHAIGEYGARALSIDPVVGAISGEIDSHKDHSIRRVLAPLAQVAERSDLERVRLDVLHIGAVTP